MPASQCHSKAHVFVSCSRHCGYERTLHAFKRRTFMLLESRLRANCASRSHASQSSSLRRHSARFTNSAGMSEANAIASVYLSAAALNLPLRKSSLASALIASACLRSPALHAIVLSSCAHQAHLLY